MSYFNMTSQQSSVIPPRPRSRSHLITSSLLQSPNSYTMCSSLRNQIEPSTSPISPILYRRATSPVQETQRLSPREVVFFADKALKKFMIQIDRGDTNLRHVIGHSYFLSALIGEIRVTKAEERDKKGLKLAW